MKVGGPAVGMGFLNVVRMVRSQSNRGQVNHKSNRLVVTAIGSRAREVIKMVFPSEIFGSR